MSQFSSLELYLYHKTHPRALAFDYMRKAHELLIIARTYPNARTRRAHRVAARRNLNYARDCRTKSRFWLLP